MFGNPTSDFFDMLLAIYIIHSSFLFAFTLVCFAFNYR